MKLLIQEINEPNCLVYSAAMVLGIDPERIFKIIRHRGQVVAWPNQDWPTNLAGVHIQEIQDVALTYGKCFYPIEYNPESRYDVKATPYYPYKKHSCVNRFYSYTFNRKGIFIGKGHAVAWDGRMIYDPNGEIYSFSDFLNQYGILEAWLLGEII